MTARALRIGALATAAVATLAACGKDDALPGCRIAQQATLPRTALTLARDATLLRAGDGAFVLAAVDGDTVRWASLAGDGTLSAESSLKLPATRTAGVRALAVAGKNAPGDQLVALFADAAGVQAIAQTIGGDPMPARKVLDLPAGATASSLRLSAAGASNGQRVVVTVGAEGAASPMALVLKADAVPAGAPIAVYGKEAVPAWRCLGAVAPRGAASVAVVEPGGPRWRVFELRDDGSLSYDAQVGLDATPGTCPVVATTPNGYVIAFQNDDGTFFTAYDIDHNNVAGALIAGALRFGGPHLQPPVVAIAPMGNQYAILFDRAAGHEAWRFDAAGAVQGSPLALPSASGTVGPLSALSALDAMRATYLDAAPRAAGAADANSAQDQRYFVRIDCPAAPERTARDAGGVTDAAAEK